VTPRRRRAPATRPGPGSVSSLVVRRLDLRVRRRIHGLLPGDIRSTQLGHGTELAQIRPYRPGDDVRVIDWNVTARTGEPHVRLHIAERALTTWIVLDRSPSMGFGTQERTKADVAEGVVLALCRLATSGANRLAVVMAGTDTGVALPPTGDHRLVVRALAGAPLAGGGAEALAEAIALADRVSRRSGAVVVVSDFRGPRTWERPLARLARRHHTLVAEVLDPREQRLVDTGEVVLSDPETGRQLRVDTADRSTLARFGEAADAERADVRRAIRSTGAAHVALSTSGDWLRTLAAALSRRSPRRP
jgi:uncharacterized protein (DUF58 family)